MIANVNERENLNEFTLVVERKRERSPDTKQCNWGAKNSTSNVLLLFITATTTALRVALF